MNNITDRQILEEATHRLTHLLEEARIAEIEKEKRDKNIQKAKAVVELFSDGISDSSLILAKSEKVTPDLTENTQDTSTIKSAFEYPEGTTWQERIKAYFKFKNKVITIAQIVEEFEKHQPQYEIKKLKGVVANTVSLMIKRGLLRTYEPGIKMKGFLYGNPQWFNDKGELKEEYKPNLKEKNLW